MWSVEWYKVCYCFQANDITRNIDFLENEKFFPNICEPIYGIWEWFKLERYLYYENADKRLDLLLAIYQNWIWLKPLHLFIVPFYYIVASWR